MATEADARDQCGSAQERDGRYHSQQKIVERKNRDVTPHHREQPQQRQPRRESHAAREADARRQKPERGPAGEHLMPEQPAALLRAQKTDDHTNAQRVQPPADRPPRVIRFTKPRVEPRAIPRTTERNQRQQQCGGKLGHGRGYLTPSPHRCGAARGACHHAAWRPARRGRRSAHASPRP